jgi:hypothetical protein
MISVLPKYKADVKIILDDIEVEKMKTVLSLLHLKEEF